MLVLDDIHKSFSSINRTFSLD